jgi:hypothetical protein
MKNILLFSLFNLYSLFAFSQAILVRGSDSLGYFVFEKVDSGKQSHYQGSYSVLSKEPVEFMTHWGLSKSGNCYWTNGENIYEYSFNKNVSRLLFFNLHFILEFVVRDSLAYVVYNPSKEEDEFENRYSKGIKFCSIDLNSGSRQYFRLDEDCNITNLSISPDRQWASFINTISIKKEDQTRYQLVLYNLGNGKIKIIDSGKYQKYEWFGDAGKYNSSFWPNSSKLLYYKHFRKDDYGSILEYDLASGVVVVKLPHVPERDFTWFGFYRDAFYFSGRDNLYKTKNGIDREIVISKGLNIIEAAIYPRTK